MARRANQDVLYPKMVAAFREQPGNIQAAADKCGITWRTANRAWFTGIPSKSYPPIQTVLAEEQEKARAMLEAERLAKIAERRRELEASSEHALQARKQEGQMTGLVRQQSLVALTSVSVLAGEARKLAEAVRGQLTVERTKLEEWTAYEAKLVAGDPTATEPPWLKAAGSVRSLDSILKVLQRSAEYATRIAACARQAMEMERLHLGEPIGIIRHEIAGQDMTVAELDTRMQNGIRAVERAKQAGGLTLVHGGKDAPTVGQRVIVR